MFDYKTVCFRIPKDQYNTLEVIFNLAAKKNKNFDEDEWFSHLIGRYLEENWGTVIKNIAYYKKSRKKSPPSRKK